ncbi:substrate-binding periplasmic protein [Rugamonas rivuli]|uniref:Transporter substrate-binding domain-containing protein n=1 Tax=Rugamonas rivuli TaxID=2743358 RepID=A0A843SBY5_9BURK|nr:transporter substrate-binding domain-containing protein [Rugamonas rivuli]MQA22015.1 transporter substrate-binding domain-containing protein [Rugamonas rivuli]
MTGGTSSRRMLLAVLAAAFVAQPAAAADAITVVAPDFWCPFSCKAGTAQEGFTIDILRAIFKPLGRPVRYENLNYARALVAVRAGRYSATSPTYKDEAPDFIFPSTPISRNRYCFYTAPDSRWQYKHAASLAGQRVGIVQGYTYGKEIDQAVAQGLAAFEVNYGEDLGYRLARKLMLGRLDSFIEDENLVSYIMAKHADVRLRQAGCAPVSYSYFALSPALAESKTLAREFDEGIARLHESGQLERILKPYGLRDWVGQYRKGP